MSDWGRLQGLIPILGGVYGLLLAKGVLPSHVKDPEKTEFWRRRYGWILMIAAPVVILFGIAELFGLFS